MIGISIGVIVAASIYLLMLPDNSRLDEADVAKRVAKANPPAMEAQQTKPSVASTPVLKKTPVADGKPSEKRYASGASDFEVSAEEAYARNQMFEYEALDTFPLHTIETHNPLQPQAYGPQPGEIWIRVKVEHGRELKDIMAQVADLYRTTVRAEGPVTVMHWVGGRPHARYQYPPAGE